MCVCFHQSKFNYNITLQNTGTVRFNNSCVITKTECVRNNCVTLRSWPFVTALTGNMAPLSLSKTSNSHLKICKK